MCIHSLSKYIYWLLLTVKHYFSSRAKLVNKTSKILAHAEFILKLEEKQTMNKIKKSFIFRVRG